MVRITLGGSSAQSRETTFVIDGFEVLDELPTDALSGRCHIAPYVAVALVGVGAAALAASRRRRPAIPG